jgi:polyisoprenoid-binding protein YceI
MKTNKALLMAFLALIVCTCRANAQGFTWTIDPAHSSSEFQVRHLGVSNVHGSITGVKGTVIYDEKDITKSSVTATLDTSTVTTSNEMRDKDLKSSNFFDVAKYPTMSFKSTSISRNNGKVQMLGDLTLNGVTKSIALDVDGPAPPQKGMGGKIVSGFSATGVLKRADFNFGSKYPAPMVGDEVKLTIDIEIGRQP